MPDNIQEAFFTIRFTQEGTGPVTCDLFGNDEEEEITSAIGDTPDEALSSLIASVTFATSLKEI